MAKRKTPKKEKMSEVKTKQVAKEIAEKVEPIIDSAVAKIILATFDELVEEHDGDRESAVIKLVDMGDKIMKSGVEDGE